MDKLAEETARSNGLEALHGSPTDGNRTTAGSTIDLREFWYMDAHHKNFSYLFDQVKAESQTKTMAEYAYWVLKYMKQAKYPIPEKMSWQTLNRRFYERF